jgi:hypothetical protein
MCASSVVLPIVLCHAFSARRQSPAKGAFTDEQGGCNCSRVIWALLESCASLANASSSGWSPGTSLRPLPSASRFARGSALRACAEGAHLRRRLAAPVETHFARRGRVRLRHPAYAGVDTSDRRGLMGRDRQRGLPLHPPLRLRRAVDGPIRRSHPPSTVQSIPVSRAVSFFDLPRFGRHSCGPAGPTGVPDHRFSALPRRQGVTGRWVP